jgi:hypothetical protein
MSKKPDQEKPPGADCHCGNVISFPGDLTLRVGKPTVFTAGESTFEYRATKFVAWAGTALVFVMVIAGMFAALFRQPLTCLALAIAAIPLSMVVMKWRDRI